MEVFVGKDKGRWPKGTRVRKVCSQPGDAHEDGALGTIVGALGPTSPGQRAELIIELAKKGVNGDVEYFYWVEWDDMLGIPVGIADCRIEPIEELGMDGLKEVKVKVIDSMWFNTLQGSFGFVVGEDETTGKRRLYAGVVSGLDQKADEQELLSWGNKVNIGMMEGLIAKTKASKEEV